MNEKILKTLADEQLISPEQVQQIKEYEHSHPFSLHWELKTFLYLGVILLNIGLGLLIYLNIDTIGHQAVIALIAASCIACFWYAEKHKPAFSLSRTESPSPYFDYIVLLGCFTFLILEGYLQYQYQVFGQKYGLATFIPMVLFFFVAYYFDHKGILAMAITALASWLGIAVTPLDIFDNNNFASARIIYTGIILGIVLCGASFLLAQRHIKKHFSFVYLNFGANILFISCLAGLMALDHTFLFSALLALTTLSAIFYAKKENSFYFLVMAVLYAYWGVSYLMFQIEALQSNAIFWYFIVSCAAILIFLAQYKKILKVQNNDSV
jgi:hypothetical protein